MGLLLLGLFLCGTALAAGLYAVLAAPVERIAAARRQAPGQESGRLLESLGDTLVKLVDTIMRKRGWYPFKSAEIELAGLTISASSLVVAVSLSSITALLFGLIIGVGLLGGVLFAVLVPLGTKVLLRIKTAKRRAAFSTQLDSTLQLLGSALRAGHSMPHALNTVSGESDSPTKEEFARIVNEHRLGKDMVEAMQQTSARMENEDFGWVAEAVGIQRDTGGNLSEILDRVGDTIRERIELRARIDALASESKASAAILMFLPVAVGLFYTALNPSYMKPLFTSSTGHWLLGGSLVMYAVSALWLRSIVKVKL